MLPARPLLASLSRFSDEEPLCWYARLASLPLLHPASAAPSQRPAGATLREPGPSNTMAAPRDFAAQPLTQWHGKNLTTFGQVKPHLWSLYTCSLACRLQGFSRADYSESLSSV
jgi:hypothetical protein